MVKFKQNLFKTRKIFLNMFCQSASPNKKLYQIQNRQHRQCTPTQNEHNICHNTEMLQYGGYMEITE